VKSKEWDPVIVIVLHDEHTYTSSGRRRTTVPTSTLIAYKALFILMAKPNLVAKKIQKMLQDKYNVTIGYDTTWYMGGKISATTELEGYHHEEITEQRD
jgi:hypothetical protein